MVNSLDMETIPAQQARAKDIARKQIVVLGMGNLLRRDEGLGIRGLQRLAERYVIPDEVIVVDGGTLGLELLSYLEQADRLLVLDAALTEGAPGTLLRLSNDDVPAYLGIKTSPHEVGLVDLLGVCRLRGKTPDELVVIGMQPELIELGWELSPAVEERLDAFADAAANELRRWGVALVPAAVAKKKGGAHDA